MKKVLITGGAGFIGYHLGKKLLSEGYQVDFVDNLARGVVDPDLMALQQLPLSRFVQADLLNPAEFAKLAKDYRYIFHLAAIIGVAHVLNRPFQVLADNTTLLINMLAFAREQTSLERFIFTSTSEVYAGTLQHFNLPIPTPESTPLAVTDLKHPRTSYMLSKIYGEALCHQSGLPYTIIRPHNFYGPRMGLSHVIPELLQRAYEAHPGGKLPVYTLEHRRTFCYIDDAVEMMYRLSQAPAAVAEVCNVGNQHPEVTIKELAELIVKTVGKNLSLVPREGDPGSPVRRCPDMTKTASITAYRSQVSLAQGVSLTFDWYRQHIFAGKGPSAV